MRKGLSNREMRLVKDARNEAYTNAANMVHELRDKHRDIEEKLRGLEVALLKLCWDV